MSTGETASEIIERVLLSEGAAPGSSLHSWRCEYPDRYGECHCVAETSAVIADALAPKIDGLLAEARAEAWDQGYTSGHSNAMRRMSDEPNAPTTANPYRTAANPATSPEEGR